MTWSKSSSALSFQFAGVLERLDLRIAAAAGLELEQHVVIGVRVERRIEVDQIDAVARDVIAQDIEIVAIEKLVHAHPLIGLVRLTVGGGWARPGRTHFHPPTKTSFKIGFRLLGSPWRFVRLAV